jgi:molybdenum cofactor synthesis domain-containing protein
MNADPTAAILLIGNEILSGKVEDENARFLTRELRALGVSLRRIEVVPDALDDIAASVSGLAQRFDHVFTSGGVGPTHDDVTLRAVGDAFGMEIARRTELEALLRAGYGDHLHERDLRMADIPVGARLEYGPSGPQGAGRGTWPVVVVRNVWILPGVPSIFRRKFETVRELFRAGPIHGRALFSRAGEGHIAGALDEAVARFPDVEIGSYPHPEASDYRVKITLDGRDAARVDDALAWLAARLGEALVRTD